MIRVAEQLVDQLSVLVCARECEPIDGKLRLKWVRESVGRNTDVLYWGDDVPQEPSEHPEFWSIWRRLILDCHPENIDIVFGSEPYIARLAYELGAEPHFVDPARETVPISATAIRENPALNWSFIAPAAREHFQKRICILGPESVGKSEMSKHLASIFATQYIPEYGRTYDQLRLKDVPWVPGDFISLIKGHNAVRSVIAREAGPVVIEDTDGFQTLVWAEHLTGNVPEELKQQVSQSRLADLYLLLKPDVPWVDDGTRYSGQQETRDWFFTQLEGLLKQDGANYRIISGTSWEDRNALAAKAVASLIAN